MLNDGSAAGFGTDAAKTRGVDPLAGVDDGLGGAERATAVARTRRRVGLRLSVRGIAGRLRG